jgi:SNF2 family DNA or RNA helicase
MKEYNNIHCVTQPEKIKTRLFKHQLTSIYNMERLEHDKMIYTDDYIKEINLGINADISGYGKTYSMIGLVSRDKMEWDMKIPFVNETVTVESNGLVKIRKIERFNKLPCTLILVSSSIINQWQNELENTTLSFTSIKTKKDIENVIIENHDIVLVIPSMYNNLVKSYSKYVWKRFIFDEPGHLRVSGMKDIKAGFFWFITSNPNSIIPYHQSCRGSMMFKIITNNNSNTFEEQFKDVIIKNDEDFIKSSFLMPKTNYKDYYCFQPIFNVINGMVNPVIQKMIDTGNIEGAISSLGGSKTRNIVELVKRKKWEEIEVVKSHINIHTIKNNTKRIEHYNSLLKNLEHDLTIIDERFSNIMSNQNCHICMNNMSKVIMEPNCQNLFCGECLLKWLLKNNTCPLCRCEIVLSDLIYIENDKEPKYNTNNVVNNPILMKTDQIIKIIESKKDGKFLVFSDFEGSFKPICKNLEKNNIKFIILKGDPTNRSKIIDEYKNGEVNVIFLNSTIDSAGINLQETTDIILYHEMNSINKNQIVARAERIGRTEELTIHQLLVHI